MASTTPSIVTYENIKSIIAKGNTNTLDQNDPQYITQKAIYDAYKKVIQEVAPKIAPLDALIKTVNDLQAAKQPLSSTDQATLDKAISDRDGLLDYVNSYTQPSSVEIEKVKQNYAIQQINNIRPTGKIGLNYTKPVDLVEYIVRTQAINPYGRERECDIRFVKMLSLVSGDMNNTAKELEKLKDFIIKKVKNYEKGPV